MEKTRLAVADQVAPVAPAGKDDPVVEAPFQAVGDRLDVVAAKPAQNDLADIGDAVAVGVLQIPEMGRREDEDAPLVAADGRGPRQLVRKDDAAIGLAVAVGVLQQPHDAGVLLAAPARIELGRFPGEGIVPHFGHVHPPVLVEARVDGAGHERLGGDELEMKTVLKLKSRQRLCGLDGRNPGQLVGQRLRGRLIGRAGDEPTAHAPRRHAVQRARAIQCARMVADGVRASSESWPFRSGRTTGGQCPRADPQCSRVAGSLATIARTRSAADNHERNVAAWDERFRQPASDGATRCVRQGGDSASIAALFFVGCGGGSSAAGNRQPPPSLNRPRMPSRRPAGAFDQGRSPEFGREGRARGRSPAARG